MEIKAALILCKLEKSFAEPEVQVTDQNLLVQDLSCSVRVASFLCRGCDGRHMEVEAALCADMKKRLAFSKQQDFSLGLCLNTVNWVRQ